MVVKQVSMTIVELVLHVMALAHLVLVLLLPTVLVVLLMQILIPMLKHVHVKLLFIQIQLINHAKLVMLLVPHAAEV